MEYLKQMDLTLDQPSWLWLIVLAQAAKTKANGKKKKNQLLISESNSPNFEYLCLLKNIKISGNNKALLLNFNGAFGGALTILSNEQILFGKVEIPDVSKLMYPKN